MYAMLISSDDPFDKIYYPQGKWNLFNERIEKIGSALWGINAGNPKGINMPFWIYVHIKGTGQTSVRMQVINYIYFVQSTALLNDERRIPRFRTEKLKLFFEINKLEMLKNPLNTFSLKKKNGATIGNAPQKFSYIQDPLLK